MRMHVEKRRHYECAPHVDGADFVAVGNRLLCVDEKSVLDGEVREERAAGAAAEGADVGVVNAWHLRRLCKKDLWDRPKTSGEQPMASLF